MSEQNQDWRVFGLALDRRINLLALIAFVVSLVSIGLQLWDYLRGARVQLRVGDSVNLIFQAHAAQADNPVLHLNARMSYVNSGAVGRDALIIGERLEIRLGTFPPYEYRWQHFESFVPDEQGRAERRFTDTAHDFGVPGADTVTHQTTFIAFPEAEPRNPEAESAYLTKVDFLGQITRSKMAVTLTFIAEGVTADLDPFTCRLVLPDRVVSEVNATDWVTVLCEEVNSSSRDNSK